MGVGYNVPTLYENATSREGRRFYEGDRWGDSADDLNWGRCGRWPGRLGRRWCGCRDWRWCGSRRWDRCQRCSGWWDRRWCGNRRWDRCQRCGGWWDWRWCGSRRWNRCRRDGRRWGSRDWRRQWTGCRDRGVGGGRRYDDRYRRRVCWRRARVAGKADCGKAANKQEEQARHLEGGAPWRAIWPKPAHGIGCYRQTQE